MTSENVDHPTSRISVSAHYCWGGGDSGISGQHRENNDLHVLFTDEISFVI